MRVCGLILILNIFNVILEQQRLQMKIISFEAAVSVAYDYLKKNIFL